MDVMDKIWWKMIDIFVHDENITYFCNVCQIFWKILNYMPKCILTNKWIFGISLLNRSMYQHSKLKFATSVFVMNNLIRNEIKFASKYLPMEWLFEALATCVEESKSFFNLYDKASCACLCHSNLHLPNLSTSFPSPTNLHGCEK